MNKVLLVTTALLLVLTVSNVQASNYKIQVNIINYSKYDGCTCRCFNGDPDIYNTAEYDIAGLSGSISIPPSLSDNKWSSFSLEYDFSTSDYEAFTWVSGSQNKSTTGSGGGATQQSQAAQMATASTNSNCTITETLNYRYRLVLKANNAEIVFYRNFAEGVKKTNSFCKEDEVIIEHPGTLGSANLKSNLQYRWDIQYGNTSDNSWSSSWNTKGNVVGANANGTISLDAATGYDRAHFRLMATHEDNTNWYNFGTMVGTLELYKKAPIIPEFNPGTAYFNSFAEREFSDPDNLINIQHETYPGAENGKISINGYNGGTNHVNIYLRRDSASSQVYTYKAFSNSIEMSFPEDADNFNSPSDIPNLKKGEYRLILENIIGATEWAGDGDGEFEGLGEVGCFQEYRVKILTPEKPLEAALSADTEPGIDTDYHIYCNGQNDTLSLERTQGGIGTLSYSITRIEDNTPIASSSNYNGNFVPISSTDIIAGYSYKLEITDQLNPGIVLYETSTEVLLEPEKLLVPHSYSPGRHDDYIAPCNGQNFDYAFQINGGVFPYDISFNEDEQTVPDDETEKVFNDVNLSNNLKDYPVTIIDEFGCQLDTVITITAPPVPEPILTKHVVNEIGGVEYHISCLDNADGLVTYDETSLRTASVSDYRYTEKVFLTGGSLLDEEYILDADGSKDISIPNEATYQVEFEDQYGCRYSTNSFKLEVTPPAAIDILNDARISPTCHRYEDGAFAPAFLNGNGAGNNYRYSIDGQSDEFTNLEEISGLAAGDYLLNITDEKDCSSQDSFTIDETPEVFVAGSSIIDTYVDCKGDSNAVLTARGLKGGSSITLASAEWRRAEGGDVFSGDISLSDQPAGTYYLKVFDNLGCFSREQSITVPEGLEVQFQNLSVDPETCLDEDNGSAYFTLNTLDPRGRTADLTYQLLDDGYNPIGGSSDYNDWGGEISSLAPGDYYLTAVEDNLNCPSDTIPFHIEAADFTAAVIDVMHQSCAGVADGSVSFSFSGGQSPYSSFVISVSGDTIQAPQGLPESVPGLAPGSYDAFASDANGCLLVLGEVTIDAANPVLLDVTITDFYCEATPGSLSVVPSGGAAPYEVFVEGNGSGSQSDLNALSANTYYIQVLDANGCSAYDTLEIRAAEEPLISHTLLDTTYCNLPLASAEISISNYDIADFDFEWNDPDAQTGALASHLAPGNYEVMIQDKATACQWVHPVDIGQSVEGLSVASLVTDASCNTANGSVQVNVSEGILPYTFAWPSDAYVADPVSGFADSLASGVYEVEVVDANGCSTIHAFSISDENGPAIFMVDSVAAYCSLPVGRLEYFVQGGQAPYAYSWASDDGSDVSFVNTPFADNIKAGTYFFTVEDSRKCKAVRSSIVVDDQTVEPHLSLVITSPAACGKPLGYAQVRMSGGLPGYSYLWNDPSSQASEVASGLLAGVDYQVVATDAKGCKDSLTVLIDELPDPVLSYVDKTETYCGLAVGEIQVTADGPSPGFTYWLDDAVSFSSGLLNDVSPGWHTITAEDENGCFTHPIQVQLLDLPALQVSLYSLKGIDCFGDDNGGIELSLENGVAPYSFLWDGSLSGSDPFNYSLAAGAHDVIVTDANGCAESLAFEVPGVAPLALESVTFTSPGCVGLNDGSIKVSVTGGTQPYSYQWSNGMEGDLIVGLGAGAYALLVTDANGCVMDTTIFLEEPIAPSPIGLPDFEIVCTGQQYILDAGPGYLSYYWHNEDDFESQQQKITITEQGYYYLDVVNSQGCPQADTFYLETSNSLLEADFVMTSEARVGDTIVIVDITIPEPVNKSWSYDEGLDFISEEFNTLRLKSSFVGTYEVTLTTSLAECNSMMAKEVRVIGAEEASELPGARTGASNMDKPEIEVFPNPSDGYFTCSIELQHTNMVVVSIYHLQQKEAVYRMVLEGLPNYTLPIDLRGKAKGTYLLKVDSNQGAAGKLLIVK